MPYNYLFNDDWRLITLGTISLVIIFSCIIICCIHNKVKWIDKWFSRRRMISIMFILALIIGLAISGSNGFKIFKENNESDLWIKHLIYLMATFINIYVTIMFLGFIFTLPFRYFDNFYNFYQYHKPRQKIFKVSMMYFGFGALALLLSCSQYGFGNSFFAFASDFSNHPSPLDDQTQPTLFYLSGYILLKFLKIKELSFSVIFFVVLLCVIIGEIIILKLLDIYFPKQLSKLIKVSNYISNHNSAITLLTPVFSFTSMLTSLMVQTIATFLRISLVIILFLSLCLIINFLTGIYAISFKSLTIKLFSNKLYHASKQILKNPISDKLIKNINKHEKFRGFNDFGNEQDIYNIFLNSIFPLMIVAYLGFSSGPLLDQNFPIVSHILFWVFLYLIGYLLMFAYAFKFSDLIPMKMVLSNATPYIKSGFNSGILSFFNPIINKVSLIATYSIYLAIACKHDYHYRKVII